MKNYKLFYAFLLIIFAAAFVSAQRNTDQPNPNLPLNNNFRIAKILDLTAEQLQTVRELNQIRRPQRREALQKLREARSDLDSVIYANEIDESIVQTKINAVISAEVELIKLNTRYELAIRNILTPDQLIKFRELRARVKQQREERILKRQQNRKRNSDNIERDPQNAPNRKKSVTKN